MVIPNKMILDNVTALLRLNVPVILCFCNLSNTTFVSLSALTKPAA